MSMEQAQRDEVPSYTKELIPNIVDHLAKVQPHKLYAEYPISSLSYQEGYRKITYGDFANAVNGMAWWLHEALGPGENFEVLAYIGPNDLRYTALILGAVKVGYLAFLTSPRNSVAAQINLFERLKCKILLSPNPRPPPVTAILDAHDFRILEIPSVDDLLNQQHAFFPFKKTFADAVSDPLFVVHTSGSTGFPKPLIYTHDTAARNITMISLDPPVDFKSQDKMYQNKKLFISFPPFHGAYLVAHFFNAVPFGTVMIAPTSGEIPSAQGLVEGLKKSPADIAFIVPSIVQELSQSPELLDYCAKNLEMIMFCGGDLTQSIGDVVSSKIRLVNQYGASELGLIALIQSKSHRDPGDWKYVEFHPDTGAQFRHVTDDVYELCIARHPKLEQQQPSFTFFPELQEYPTRDLFVRHPAKDKSNMWRWVARADDVIVFINGEKTNPISMEQHIVSRNPGVAAVLVVGAQRFQAALLIELVTNEKELSPSERAAFIEKIWPTIEEANQECPAHARIAKTHILFTDPKNPMLRAGKGTIQRAGTLQLYAQKLDSLYADADVMSYEINGDLPDRPAMDIDTASRIIKEKVLSVTHWETLDDTDNLFTRGMDSFQALLTVRNLKQGLFMPNIALSTIYTNPSVSTLAGAILLLSKQDEVSQSSQKQAQYQERSGLIKEYQGLIDRLPMPSQAAKNIQDQTVILTGSSGALGSYILNALLNNLAVSHVFCLNRAVDGFSLQTERNKARGLSTNLSSNRVTFLTADFSQTHLGLESETYNRMLDVVTLVIHNAWPVNFNLSLSSFRPQLTGLVNFIEFTSLAATSPHMLFISSISSVLSYRNDSLQTLEEVIFDNHAPGPNGYSESKYVSERLLDHAARRLSINVSFARVGQLAGAVEYPGLWNKAEWFPSLVISSVHVGAVPDTLGPILDRIDWVPIDLLAEIVVELALSEDLEPKRTDSQESLTDTESPRKQACVFHPLNRHPTTWQAIKPTLTAALSSLAGKHLSTVPPDIWLGKIRQEIESTAATGHKLHDGDLDAFLRVNPAVKLLDFYEEMLRAGTGPGNVLAIGETERRSARLRALEGIKAEWVGKWVGEWMEQGGVS